MGLYLITRGQAEKRWNSCPAPACVTDNKKVAAFRAGDSSMRNNVWFKGSVHDPSEGWVLDRWCGLDIDYGAVLSKFPLPDGSTAGIFHHRTNPDTQEPWQAISGAVWWSWHKPPQWLFDYGIRLPDAEQRLMIRDDFVEAQPYKTVPGISLDEM